METSNQDPDKLTFSPDVPPETILKILADELAKPVISIEAISEIVLNPSSTDEHRELLHNIPTMTRYMKSLLDAVHEYIELRQRKDRC